MPEISIAMRVDDPMLQIVSEVSKDLSEWTWVMRRNTEIDQWEINEDLVEFVGWESLGDGMQEARLRYLGDREKIFTRMAVNYKSGE